MRTFKGEKYKAKFFKPGCDGCDISKNIICWNQYDNFWYSGCRFLGIIPVIWKKVVPKVPFKFTYQTTKCKLKFKPQ